MSKEYETFLNQIKKERIIKIYGAGKFAKTLGYFFLKQGIEVEAFIVSESKKNPTELLSRPVIELNTLESSQLSSIVVGFEKENYKKEVCEVLQTRLTKNIIIVPSSIIDNIYYNYIIDATSLESWINDLKKKSAVFVYVNDSAGDCFVTYMRKNNVQIKALCTEQTEKFLSLNLDVPLLPYHKFLKQDKNIVVVLAIKEIYRKKSLITRFRKEGFEKIILLPDDFIEEAIVSICRMLWENRSKHSCFIENANVESNHYLTQIKQNEKVYRWRNPMDGSGFCGLKIQERIQTGSLLRDYRKQYADCCFIPYEECLLSEVSKPKIVLEVYMAKFYKDKKIVSYTLPEWVIPIQVGKALTDIRVAECCDNTGDHISEKNVDYSEGTALYWMWKNTKGQDYIGLFHYRRQMAMGATTLKQMLSYDMLLTPPTYLGVSVKDFFCRYFVLFFDWKLMMEYIKEYDADYYETAQKYEKRQFYFSSNIFIMRREFFDEMCVFIFEVLEKIDAFYHKSGLERKDRYLGYLVENLLSIYVMHHAEKLKLAYTDMIFYESIESKR